MEVGHRLMLFYIKVFIKLFSLKIAFYEILSKKKAFLKKMQYVCDIGCGTGALSFIYNTTIGSKNIKYFGIDNNLQAIRSTEINALLQDISMKTCHFDMKSYIPNELEPRFGNNFNENTKFDVILSNPPWLVAKPLEIFIDSGNYDPNEEFLKKLISFVSMKLEREKGVFYLIYSDLSQLLGVQEEKRVEQLVKQNGMNVLGVYRYEGMVNMSKIQSHFDALKQKAHLVIYEIGF